MSEPEQDPDRPEDLYTLLREVLDADPTLDGLTHEYVEAKLAELHDRTGTDGPVVMVYTGPEDLSDTPPGVEVIAFNSAGSLQTYGTAPFETVRCVRCGGEAQMSTSAIHPHASRSADGHALATCHRCLSALDTARRQRRRLWRRFFGLPLALALVACGHHRRESA